MTVPLPPDGRPVIIAPIDFRPAPAARPRASRRRVVTIAVLALLGLVLASSGWFVLTARRVTVTVTPTPERFELTGPPLRFEAGDAFLLQRGTYTVRAERAGHVPLEETFTVTGDSPSDLAFTIAERPGLVTMTIVGADDPSRPLDGAVIEIGGVARGTTPLAPLAVDRGEHAVRIVRDRYQVLATTLTVAGLGQGQSETRTLRPDWADVELSSTPAGAEVRLDGAAIGTTPCRFTVPSGSHVLEVETDGHDPWRRAVTIVAEQPVAFTDIVLAPAPGRLVVETDPAGAQVTIDGVYAGTAPVEVQVPPDRDVEVRAVRDGYDPARRTARVAPRATETVTLTLAAQTGTVVLEVEPAGATLVVDGQSRGPVPPSITLTAIEHELRFTLPGHTPVVRTVRPRPGILSRVRVELTAVAAAPPVVTAPPPPLAAGNGYPLLRVPSAAYAMGSSQQEPGRRTNETLRAIELKRPFLLGTREVTNAEYAAFDASHDSGRAGTVALGDPNQPVVNVTWDDAARFCNWLSGRDGLPPAYVAENGAMRAVSPMTTGYRLPTEAEWEYVARFDGTEALRKYPWGATFPPPAAAGKVGNFAGASADDLVGLTVPGYDDGFAATAPVGSFPPAHFGHQDLGGNVAEWCHDFYTTYTYNARTVAVDPTGPARGRHHVVRGSSWRHATIGALRFAYRDYGEEGRDDLGFRIGRYLEPETGDDP